MTIKPGSRGQRLINLEKEGWRKTKQDVLKHEGMKEALYVEQGMRCEFKKNTLHLTEYGTKIDNTHKKYTHDTLLTLIIVSRSGTACVGGR